jgi:penicillin-binding protein 1C
VVAADDRYDGLGRVVLPREYDRWLRSELNWVGAQAVAGPMPGRLRDQPLRIVSPLAGATLILDPDLPGGGRKLPLRTNPPAAGAEWSSETLEIDVEGGRSFAHLKVGRHEIRVRDAASGETAAATITVRSL